MSHPPAPLPKSIFVAAFAVAASSLAPLRRLPVSAQPIAPSSLARRDTTLRRYITAIGRGIVAAGRARRLFYERGAAMHAAPTPRAPHVDARIRAIAGSATVRAAIGPVAPAEHPEHAWVELGENHVTLFWRGDLIQGDRQTRALKDGGVVKVDRVDAFWAPSRDRFLAAAHAARDALDAAGFPTSGLVDVRWLQIGPQQSIDAIRTYAGLVATIGLRRRKPIWMNFSGERGHARGV